jgi:hypothetical protein
VATAVVDEVVVVTIGTVATVHVVVLKVGLLKAFVFVLSCSRHLLVEGHTTISGFLGVVMVEIFVGFL